MKRLLKVWVFVSLGCLLSSTCHAWLILEILGTDADPWLRHAQLYGHKQPYSAEVEVTISCSTNCPVRRSVIQCADFKGWARTDVDLQKTTGIEGRTAADLLQWDHSILIWRPDRNMSYRICPARKGYYEEPGLIKPGEKYVPPGPEPLIGNKPLDSETIDGHPCLKFQRTFKGAQLYEMTVWEAKDLGGFCIQMQYTDAPLWCEDSRCTITMLFKKISFKPDPSLFEVPKDYQRYDEPLKLLEPDLAKQKSH